MPFVNITKEFLTLLVRQHLSHAHQHSWIPEAQQCPAAVWHHRVQFELKQLRQPVQALRRDDPRHGWRLLFEHGKVGGQLGACLFYVDQPRAGVRERRIRRAFKKGIETGPARKGLHALVSILDAVDERIQA